MREEVKGLRYRVTACNGRPVPGGISVVVSVIPAAAALKLARYKNDLADR